VPAWLGDNLVTVVDGVAFGMLLFTIAVGLSLVFGIMDVLNLAHGDTALPNLTSALALVRFRSVVLITTRLGRSLLARPYLTLSPSIFPSSRHWASML